MRSLDPKYGVEPTIVAGNMTKFSTSESTQINREYLYPRRTEASKTNFVTGNYDDEQWLPSKKGWIFRAPSSRSSRR